MLECPTWMNATAFSLGTATPLMTIERPDGGAGVIGVHAALVGRPQRSDAAQVAAEVQAGSGVQVALPVLAMPLAALPVLATPLVAVPLDVPVLAAPVPA